MTEREIFFRHLGLPAFTPMALEITRAEGVILYDRSGRDYIDFISGISVSNLGHRHPAVLSAIREQLDHYLYLNVYGEFILSPQVRLAERLAKLLPPELDAVYFVNSGSEAVEGALKLAKRYTGRTEIIAFRNAYHGSSHGALSVLGNERLKQAFRPLLPDVRLLEFNNLTDLELISNRTACVITETTMSEAGVIRPAEGFLQKLYSRCKETGALLIIDDVQMGIGRTGHLFSFEPYGIIPDILVLAKALGAGMPLGTFIASKSIMDTLAFNPVLGHITTFGGHPVSCAAALAGIDTILSEGHIQTVHEKGQMIVQRLRDHPKVAEIRSQGLAIGVELREGINPGVFLSRCLEMGVVTDFYLFAENTFRIAPPLIISQHEIIEGIRRITAALDLS